MEERTRGNSASQQPRKRRRRQKSIAGRVIRGILLLFLTVILVGGCTTAMIGGIFMKYVETTLAPTLDVRAEDYTMKLSSIVYYQDEESGEWVEFQKVHGTENRIWVDLKDMPDALWQAASAIEDERFFLHKGVDWKRTVGATVNMFVGMKNTFGGSTITQQLLKNMTEDNDGTVNRKVREIFRALRFEENYTKEQILELYLNTIYLGQGCYGVQTAAEFYFGKDVSELNVAECASLIAITNNPSMYGPMFNIKISQQTSDGSYERVTPRELNKRRQELILDKMAEVGKDGHIDDGATPYLTEAECEAAKAEILQFSDGSTSAEAIVAKANQGLKVNDWFVEQVLEEVAQDLAEARGVSKAAAYTMLNNGGYQIYTTMDRELQEIAKSVYENRSNLDVTSPKGELLQSGITIIDPYTGYVRAMVGCVGKKEGNLWTNYAVETHQVGSSIKPLTVYSAALEAGVVTPATTFDNYPVRLLNESPWPKNSPNKYTGWTMVGTGVQNSINTIAVQTLEALGCPEAFAYATEKLRLNLVAEDMDVSPLAMGGLTHGLNTVEMAAAYSVFANNGVYNEPRMYLELRDAEGQLVLSNEGSSHVAVKETTAHFMNEMLQKVITSGTGTSARFSGMTIAGKTGTTDDNRTRYFVGYTPYYCAAVWTGYRTNERITYTGNPAITMWKLVMEEIHAELENRKFNVPTTGIETITVCRDSGLLCTAACEADLRGSRAIEVSVPTGSAPTEACTLHALQNYCSEGQCLATDYCSFESMIQVGVLNHTRADYFDKDGNRITAEDDAYTLVGMQKAIGMIPDTLQDGTEVYPEFVGCPVHGGYWTQPSDPFDPNNPDAPIWPDDPTGGFGDPNSGFWTPEITEPQEPTLPGSGETQNPLLPPEEPEDSTGGFGDAGVNWWDDLGI